MPENERNESEVHRRSLAVEGAMLVLIDGLAARGTISADEAEDMLLRILSKSSEFSAARASSSLRIVRQLKRLRRGDGQMTPGAQSIDS